MILELEFDLAMRMKLTFTVLSLLGVSLILSAFISSADTMRGLLPSVTRRDEASNDINIALSSGGGHFQWNLYPNPAFRDDRGLSIFSGTLMQTFAIGSLNFTIGGTVLVKSIDWTFLGPRLNPSTVQLITELSYDMGDWQIIF